MKLVDGHFISSGENSLSAILETYIPRLLWIAERRISRNFTHLFDADDVVFSLQLAMDTQGFDEPHTVAIRDQLARVEKIDARTVRLTLNAPNPRFVIDHFSTVSGSSFTFVPEHLWPREELLSFRNPAPIGTGRYHLDLSLGAPTIWHRSGRWWGAETGFGTMPEPKYLERVHANTEEDRLRALARNSIDAGLPMSPAGLDGLQAIAPFVASWSRAKSLTPSISCVNSLWASNLTPFDVPELKAAVLSVIDRNSYASLKKWKRPTRNKIQRKRSTSISHCIIASHFRLIIGH